MLLPLSVPLAGSLPDRSVELAPLFAPVVAGLLGLAAAALVIALARAIADAMRREPSAVARFRTSCRRSAQAAARGA